VWEWALGISGVLVLARYIGAKSIQRRIDKQVKLRDAAIEYLQHFQAWSSSGCKRDENYSWLLGNLVHFASEMGSLGYMSWKPRGFPPGSSQRVHVLNYGIAYLADGGWDSSFWFEQVENALIAYIGYRNRAIENIQENFQNSFTIMKVGLRGIVTSPLRLLNFSGLISDETLDKWIDGPLGSMMTLLGLLSSALALIVEIGRNVETVMSWFRR